MFALLLRRWLLTALLVPVLVVVLRKAGRYLEHRHDDQPTAASRTLLKASSALTRFSRRHRDAEPE